MDMYLSPQDTLSLQEMLDCDYKTDFDSVLAGADLGLSLSGDLPPLELDEALGGAGDMTMWFSNGLHSGNSNSSNSNFNLDFVGSDAAAMMVNPSSVMPVTLVSVPMTTNNSSNLIISTSALSPVAEEEVVTLSSSSVTAPSSSSGNAVSYVRTLSTSTPSSPSSTSRQRQQPTATTIRIAAATSTSHAHSSSNGLPSLLATSKTVPIITSSTKLSHQHQQQQKSLTHIQVNNTQNHGRTLQLQQSQTHVKKHHLNNNNKHFADLDYDEKPYPKPAYSYSCLIAMALKNSKTGSLPVSEIYNFMCEHFPYFKTAPNGWKNSVRHNLSLNKCFEKIEKPTGNGSQQRKGCLWAMNPAKIAKMDEEVQKWSKKDPMAIKKAMVCPENLEMLERGEMKREFSGLSSMSNGVSSSLSGGEESDGDDVIDVSDAVDTTGSAPCTPLSTHAMPEFIDINNVALAGDSFDESSLTDFDIEVAEGIYEELEAEDDKLNLGITLTSTSELLSSTSTTLPVVTSTTRVQADYAPASKRSRLGGSTIQGNYVYKPMVSVSPSSGSSSRRKAPLLLRASAGASSLIKLEDP